METLIAYGTKHGATEKAAKRLAEMIDGNTTLINLTEQTLQNIDLSKYDRIAVGGSIYMGGIQKEVQEFCKANETLLLTKRLGLFICCGNEELIDNQLASSFSDTLYEMAAVKGYFGYEFDFEKLSFLSKFIVKKVSKISQSKFQINYENIKDFAETWVN